MTRLFRVIAVAVVICAVAAVGCAKRPALIQATAPSPTGSGLAVPAAQQPAAPAVTATAPAPAPAPEPVQPSAAPAAPPAPTLAERPVPKEFAAIPELRDIHFDFDRYEIRSADARTLDANAAWLKSHPAHLVLIEGHCDERGTNAYNLALGERRATATKNYLVAQGIQSARITIVSYGEERPQCSEHTESCWSRNRRANFLVKEQ